ncbi:DUF4124 domain-containing protein [Marinobacter nanhaiticus D15-8W]|uniref:DUF4124 domain-containing protein n=1 Tax=Marinobacter nanhaiticus D15-8W TaxID=626887 RepID=N6WUC4_9GAMM|nr:DUF4124 domain-containing protein [Marinobacter nanhaiticus D15-8W]
MARCLLFALICLPLWVHAEIYRYTDENGVVHFGDRKVQGRQQEEVKVRGGDSDWQRYQIDIVTDGGVILTDAERERIEADVNHVYRFFDDILYFDLFRTVPVNILILPDHASYQRYLSRHINGTVPPSYGVFLGATHQIVVYIREEERDATFRTISHETGHAVLASLANYMPAWLNEGLAEQMEMLAREGDHLVIRAHPGNTKVVNYLRERHLLSNVEDFLAMQSVDWRNHYIDRGYSLQAQTGEFVYFLLSTPTGRSFLTRLIHQYKRGDRTLAAYLVDEHYVGGMRVMQDNWALWLQGRRTDVITF